MKRKYEISEACAKRIRDVLADDAAALRLTMDAVLRAMSAENIASPTRQLSDLMRKLHFIEADALARQIGYLAAFEYGQMHRARAELRRALRNVLGDEHE